MATTQEIEAQLAEAEAAYHRLMIGGAPVEIRDSNGESIRYTSANASRLAQYISHLKSLLAGTTAQQRKPLRPVWG